MIIERLQIKFDLNLCQLHSSKFKKNAQWSKTDQSI